jgi:hypothetical protein
MTKAGGSTGRVHLGPAGDPVALPGGRFLMGSGEQPPVRGVRHRDRLPDGRRAAARSRRLPSAPIENLVPGSLVFTTTPGPVDVRHLSPWWTRTPGACWRHPDGCAPHRSARSPQRLRSVRHGGQRLGVDRRLVDRPPPRGAGDLLLRAQGDVRRDPPGGDASDGLDPNQPSSRHPASSSREVRTCARIPTACATAPPPAVPGRDRGADARSRERARRTRDGLAGGPPPGGRAVRSARRDPSDRGPPPRSPRSGS